MPRWTARILAAAATVVAAAALADAAPASRRAPAKATTPAPSPDAFLGYSYVHAGAASLNGWALGGSYPLSGRLRIVLDVTGHYGSFATADLSETALMAGVRGVWSWRGFRPFAEGSLGLVRTSVSAAGFSEADSDGAIALGGGADYPLSGRWAARGLVQLRFVTGEGTWDTDPRLSLGVVCRFGP